jgi:hypothetical protein
MGRVVIMGRHKKVKTAEPEAYDDSEIARTRRKAETMRDDAAEDALLGFSKEPSREMTRQTARAAPEVVDMGDGLSLIENDLSMDVQEQNNIQSVSKELFNRDNIDLKTEVSHDEINHISRLRFLQKKYGIQNVDVIIDSFLTLRVSKSRKSRAEFIKALNNETETESGKGFWSKILGGGGTKEK